MSPKTHVCRPTKLATQVDRQIDKKEFELCKINSIKTMIFRILLTILKNVDFLLLILEEITKRLWKAF